MKKRFTEEQIIGSLRETDEQDLTKDHYRSAFGTTYGSFALDVPES